MFTNVRNVIINNKRVKSIKLLNGSGALYIEPVIIDLSIDEQVIETGESATLTATLQDANGNTGVTINFEVYKDDWLVTTISGVTDNTGEATATYNSLGLGNVTIKATKTDKSATSNSVSVEDRYKYIDENYEWDIISRSTTNWRLTDFDLPINCIIEWQTTTDEFIPIAIGDNTRDDDDYPRWVCNIDGTTMTTLTADWNFHTESISFTPDQDNIYKIIRRGWKIGFYVNDVLICEQTTHNLFNISTKFRTNVYNVVDFEYVKVIYLSELELDITPNIIEIGDTSVLTATLRSNPSLIIGKTIQFTQKDKILAKDNGTIASHNDTFWDSVDNISRGNEYSTITSNSQVIKYTTITGDIIIELDVKSNLSVAGTFAQIRMGTTILKGLTLEECGMERDVWKHLKINIQSNKLSVDGTSVEDVDVTGFNRFYLRSAANYEVCFKNIKVIADDIIGSDVTDSSGVATTNYTGVGYGECNFMATTRNGIDDELNSSIIKMIDAIFYDDASSDKSSNYYINSHYGTTLTYNNGYYILSLGTSANYADLRSITNDVKGKTVNFEVDVVLNGASVRTRVYNGNNPFKSSAYTTTDGTITLENIEIPSDATSIILRLERRYTDDGNSIKFKNWRVYSV